MRILILMSDIGGGHRSCTLALQQEFAHWFPGVHEVFSVDVFKQFAPWPLDYVPLAYKYIANKLPGFWQWVFSNYGSLITEEQMATWLAGYLEPYFELLLESMRPDVLVTVNPLFHPTLFRHLQATGRDLPVVSVVSDLVTPHGSWFHSQLDLCCVPTVQAAVAARRYRVSERNVRVYGLPVRRQFVDVEVRERRAWKRLLDMEEQLPLILVIGGGEGFGTIATLVEQLVASRRRKAMPDCQVAVICGRNKALARRLAQSFGTEQVRVLGFVTDMYAWMAASDCAVTKAGPGTIMEAAAMGLPVILSGFVPGQEAENPAFVIRHGMGTYAPSPASQVSVLTEWLSDERKLGRFSDAARATACARAGQSIVEEVDRLFG